MFLNFGWLSGVSNFWKRRMDAHIIKLMKTRIRLWLSSLFHVNIFLEFQDFCFLNFFKTKGCVIFASLFISIILWLMICIGVSNFWKRRMDAHIIKLMFAIKPLFIKKGLLIFQKFMLLEKRFYSETGLKWRLLLKIIFKGVFSWMALLQSLFINETLFPLTVSYFKVAW